MPFANRIVISAAGGGKTTRVVDQALALEQGQGPTALITYTRNNVREIQLKAYERVRTIPSHVEVISWYSFLLRELARPYRSAMHASRVDGICWVEGKSVPYIPEAKTSGHYGLVAVWCRSKCSFRPLGARRPRGFCLPMLSADGAGYRSR